MAKEEYKQEKAAAKSDMKFEKRQSSADRKAALAADPDKTIRPGEPTNTGK